jgi:hypothetical protein
MAKIIELNPEWVLNEIPKSHYADGSGNISVDTDNTTDVRLITNALNMLGIPYEQSEFGDAITIFFEIEFRIECIKESCPVLHKKMKELDEKNKITKDINLN